MNIATRTSSLRPLPGDHLVTPRKGFKHHGIYLGDGIVIHYARDRSRNQPRAVRQVSLGQFEDGHGFYVEHASDPHYSRQQVVQRARTRMGERQYNLVRNNCEHFCNWCTGGSAVSAQVRRAQSLLTSTLCVACLTSLLHSITAIA